MSQMQDFGEKKVEYRIEPPILVTTAPCMYGYGCGRGPKEWFEWAAGQCLNWAHGGPNAYEYINAYSVMEVIKRPSLVLELPKDAIIVSVLSGGARAHSADGPSRFLTRAVKGKLMNWKLWAVEFRKSAEIWLHFIHTRSLDSESFQVTTMDGAPISNAQVIVRPDEHFYNYKYTAYHDLVEVVEYEKCNGDYEFGWIRTLALDKENKLLAREAEHGELAREI